MKGLVGHIAHLENGKTLIQKKFFNGSWCVVSTNAIYLHLDAHKDGSRCICAHNNGSFLNSESTSSLLVDLFCHPDRWERG